MERAFMHACGGWYARCEDSEGFHGQPSHCVVPGWGECYDSPQIAIAVARGDLPGDRPDGGEINDAEEED